MKNRILYAFLIFLVITGCKFDNQQVVKDVVDAFNSGNTANVKKNLSGDFAMEQGNEQIDAGMFQQMMDSLHEAGYIVSDSILSVSDTLIVSVLTVSNEEDISLGVQPLRKYYVKWYFSKKKLVKIQVEDDDENNAAYWKALEKARAPFEEWVEEKKAKDDAPKKVSKPVADKPKEEAKTSDSELLDEYSKLTPEEKEAVKVRSALSGIFFCSKCYFEKLDFKNDTAVVIYDSILGLAVNYTYTVKGTTVTVKNNKKEFVFELVNYEKLIGQTKGATGEFQKLRESD